MRILFVVDGRSPIALNWMAYFVQEGHNVHLASTYACRPELDFATHLHVPVAFSTFKKNTTGSMGWAKKTPRGLWSAPLVSMRTRFRQWLGPLTLPSGAIKLAKMIQEIQPDLVHAMRIPYEGMLASMAIGRVAGKKPPLLVSVWGNDFTLHAPANPWMASLTRKTLGAADGLHTDCHRDQRLAVKMGFDLNKPAVVLPGAGGIQTGIFYPLQEECRSDEPLVINPRGFRAYVRSDTFFTAVPLVLRQVPDAQFVCPTMKGVAQAERWLDSLGIRSAVTLLPNLARLEMADWFRRAWVAVSPSTHDGTPNTLLEAMACGCFPVAGDLESVREWITPGINGLLFDPGDPQALANAVLRGLRDEDLRRAASTHNTRLIQQKAEYGAVMQKAESFYRAML